MSAGVEHKCGQCSGMGSVRKFADFANGYWMDCPNCNGTGRESLPDGVPCRHAGCLSHISHPCEGCGRVGGKSATNSL